MSPIAVMDKFIGTNYNLWSIKMKMYLQSKNLWQCVENPKFETAEDVIMSQKAHAAIVLSLDDTQLLHVASAANANEAWGGLASYH